MTGSVYITKAHFELTITPLLFHTDTNIKRNSGLILRRVTLLLITTTAPTSSSSLKLTALGSNIRFCVAMWHARSKSKVFYSFSSITTSCKQKKMHGILCIWSEYSRMAFLTHNQLFKINYSSYKFLIFYFWWGQGMFKHQTKFIL